MRTIVTVIIVVLLGGAAYALYASRDTTATPDGGTASSNEVQAVREVVTGFGEKLQQVSLLAPAETVAAAMDEHYRDYVAPELLATWKANPESALGRRTSSPYPERIDVVSVTQEGEGRYRAEGNIIEVTSTGPAAAQPVTLTLEEADGSWMITSAEAGQYAPFLEQVTLRGETICLPHRDTSGPVTLECAIGFKTDSGVNYALDTSDAPGERLWDTGASLELTGILVPLEQLSTDQFQKYDIEGVLRVTGVNEL